MIGGIEQQLPLLSIAAHFRPQAQLILRLDQLFAIPHPCFHDQSAGSELLIVNDLHVVGAAVQLKLSLRHRLTIHDIRVPFSAQGISPIFQIMKTDAPLILFIQDERADLIFMTQLKRKDCLRQRLLQTVTVAVSAASLHI